MLRYDGSEPCLQYLRQSLEDAIAPDFTTKHTIICQGMDKSDELSAGLDAKIYFDILSYESTRDGGYIIDQPEDNVSQKAIRDYLLDCFKTMGENRQVIMVTHNPQFIVNLDVDNIIYLFEDENGFNVQSGALEFECDEYSILDIVANTIDGGLDSLRKRWKRYEKVSRV
jgi:predicted ATPase